jgi:hypothetical protein
MKADATRILADPGGLGKWFRENRHHRLGDPRIRENNTFRYRGTGLDGGASVVFLIAFSV